MFKLVRHFSLLSAAAILVITAALVTASYRLHAEHLVADAHERNVALARIISNGLLKRHAEHLRASRTKSGAELRGLPVTKLLDDDVDALTEQVDILKLRFLTPYGITIYSSTESEIGLPHRESGRLADAYRTGRPGTELALRSTFEAIGGLMRDLVVAETYFPITDAAGQTVTVLEVYTDVTAQSVRVWHDAALKAVVLVAALLGLYLLLLAIVRRADRILGGQYDELGKANALLEERVRSRTAELETSAREIGHANERLRDEIDERRRAETELAVKRHTLIAQQAAVKELIRVGTHEMSRPEDTLRALTETAARTLGVERVSVWLLRDNDGRLVCFDLFERSSLRHSAGYELVLEQVPGYRQALMAGGMIAADDTSSHPAMAEFKGDYLASRDIASMLDVPVVRGGRIEGVLSCEAVGERIAWSPEQQVFAVTIATLVAQLLESRDREHAVAENQARGETLQRHQETIATILEDDAFRTGDRTSALRVIARRIARSLAVDRVAIWLLEPGGEGFAHGEAYVAARDAFETPAWRTSAAFAAEIRRVVTDRMVCIDDLRAPHPMSALNELVYVPNDIRSALYAPINLHGSRVGYLTCTTVGRQLSWSADHRLALASFVNLATLALERLERERAEAELRSVNQQLAAATRAKSEFLANMSHEIRTPMNAVFGMTDLLAGTELNPRQRRLVGTISQSAKTLLTVINDILDISRIEAGRIDLERREFDPRHTIERVGELLAEEAQAKGLDFTVHVDNRMPPSVIGDQGRLRQVLVNLLGNAVKFTSKGEVALRVVCDEAEGARHRLGFTIRDTGIGIEPAAQASLFGAFMQADSSISRRFGGTGLGLSISRHLVELMGGEITLASEQGRGTTVAFAVTLERGAGGVTQSVSEVMAQLKGRRILIVDDRVSNREIVASYLAGTGAELSEASAGDDALARLAAAGANDKPFDLALIDVVMEGMGGIELVKRIRASRGFPAPRVILLSSLAWKNEAETARELGIHSVLAKPVRRSELVEEVARALATEPAAPETRTRAAEPAASWPGRHVLVVEDNPVNVEVAREYLEYYRCTCEVAHNGLEALAALEKRDFDLILMDVQMPEMDGLTATRRIREREADLGKPQAPIVGVTANAFEEDRKACADAGMSGYLGKPFEEKAIRAVLAQWLSPVSSAASRLTPDGEQGTALSESTIAMLEANRPELLYRMVRVYLDYAPKTVAGLRKAIEARDLIALKLGAHSLKSSSANVGGEILSALLRRLETAANTQNEPLARELVDDAEREFARLKAALEARVPVKSPPAVAAVGRVAQ